jgi:hypothetical protein
MHLQDPDTGVKTTHRATAARRDLIVRRSKEERKVTALAIDPSYSGTRLGGRLA